MAQFESTFILPPAPASNEIPAVAVYRLRELLVEDSINETGIKPDDETATVRPRRAT